MKISNTWYSSIRKSQHKLKSYSLNSIANRELKDRKVEYPSQTNIIAFPYVDWRRFIKYNIKDVLLQLGIERKTNDLTTYYMRSHANLTPYNKIFKETHLLRNVREMYFEQDGWVQSNNLNIIGDLYSKTDKEFYGMDAEEEEKGSFKGAINAEPLMNAPVGMIVLGVPSNNVYANCSDFDMTAFYPSIKIASNMDPSTLICKAMFRNGEFLSSEYSNRSLNQAYVEKDKFGKDRQLDLTGEAVNAFAAKNILTCAYNWFNLPSITILASMVSERLKKR